MTGDSAIVSLDTDDRGPRYRQGVCCIGLGRSNAGTVAYDIRRRITQTLVYIRKFILKITN